jgi:S1-C subfamily serine protease
MEMNKTVKILLIAMVALIFLTFAVATSAVVAYGALKVKPALSELFQRDEPQIELQAENLQFQNMQTQGEAGILIAAVQSDSPAERAGLVRGNILLEFDGTEVNTFAELNQAISEYNPGDTVDLYILHGDENKTLSVELGDRNGIPFLGISPCGCLMGRDLSIVTTPRLGLMILEVVPESPADEAGLEVGDLIVKFDGEVLERGANLADLVAAKNPGDTISLEVIKPGEEPRQVSVTLSEHPEKEGVAYLGIRYTTPPILRSHMEEIMPPDGDSPLLPDEGFVHPFDGEHFEMPEGFDHGLIVAEVFPDTAAEEAGLQKGDVITAIDGQEVSTPEAVTEAIQGKSPGDEVSLTIYRQAESEPTTYQVVLGEHPQEEGVAYLGVNLAGMMRFQFHQDGETPDILPFFQDFLDKLPSFESPPPGEEL